MRRIVKKGDVRKQEILDYSLKLFLLKGYDKTTIEDILNKTGIGKGTFYYYFKSKEELLHEIINSQANEIILSIKQISEKSGLNALEKLNEIAKIGVRLDSESFRQRIEFVRIFESPENYRFSKELSSKIHNLSLPVIESIIDQGINENFFSVNYPHLTADSFLILSDRFNHKLVELLIDKIEKHIDNTSLIFNWIDHIQDIFEKLLGVKDEKYLFSSFIKVHVQNIINTNGQ